MQSDNHTRDGVCLPRKGKQEGARRLNERHSADSTRRRDTSEPTGLGCQREPRGCFNLRCVLVRVMQWDVTILLQPLLAPSHSTETYPHTNVLLNNSVVKYWHAAAYWKSLRSCCSTQSKASANAKCWHVFQKPLKMTNFSLHMLYCLALKQQQILC